MPDQIVDIIMPLKSSSRFVAEHAASIAAQSVNNWRLNIIDCGVDDKTQEDAYQALSSFKDRVAMYPYEECSFSDPASWARFFELVPDAQVLVFANPNDVWSNDRIVKADVRMRGMSRIHGAKTPIALYSDFSFFDDTGATVEESGLKSLGIDGTDSSLGHLLVQHVAFGTTMVINRPLVDKVLEHADALDAAISIDWWLSIIAETLGVCSPISDVTVKVRRGKGESDSRSRIYAEERARLFETPEGLSAICKQAARLLEVYGDEMSEEAKQTVSALVSFPQKGKLSRIAACMRYGLWETKRRMPQISAL